MINENFKAARDNSFFKVDSHDDKDSLDSMTNDEKWHIRGRVVVLRGKKDITRLRCETAAEKGYNNDNALLTVKNDDEVEEGKVTLAQLIRNRSDRVSWNEEKNIKIHFQLLRSRKKNCKIEK